MVQAATANAARYARLVDCCGPPEADGLGSGGAFSCNRRNQFHLAMRSRPETVCPIGHLLNPSPQRVVG